MKLSLKNFKNHDNLEIDLPDTGLVRISGRSGTGKSSVLQAINFALNNKAKNIIAWTQKTAEVNLTAFGLDISRSKSPNILSCNGLQSTTAQELIESQMGMNPLEFEISSYVAQGQRNSLINLSPADQLELINALSFKDKSPEEYKDKIKVFISSTELEIEIADRKCSNLSERVIGLRENIASLQSVLRAPDMGITELFEKQIQTDLEFDAKNAEIVALKRRSDELHKLLDSDVRKKYDDASLFVKANSARAEELECDARRTENQSILVDKQAGLERISLMNLELQKISKEHQKLKMVEKNSVESGQLDSILSRNLSKINTSFSDGLDGSSDNLEDRLLDIKINSESALSVLQSLKIAVSSQAKQEIKEKIQLINQRMQDIHTELQMFSAEQEKTSKHNARVSILNDQLVVLKNKLDVSKRILGSNFSQKTSEEINLELSEIKTVGNWMISELQVLHKEQESLKKQVAENELYEATVKKIAILQTRFELENCDLTAIRTSKAAFEKMFIDAQKLESLWAKAALDVIESTISEINFRAAYWLDVLLEGKVSAELKTTKKIKSRDQSIDSINLQVMYKGQLLERISEELSGGQYSRVVLAFQLALSDLYNSPILMLDEAARGCDLETVEIMLDALKTIADRKLVLMVEHNIPSDQFDSEVELE